MSALTRCRHRWYAGEACPAQTSAGHLPRICTCMPSTGGSEWPLSPEDNAHMVKIRLMRMGMKGAPSYRIVVADARSPRDGRIIENIGWYNPRTEPSTITVDQERAKHWLQV